MNKRVEEIRERVRNGGYCADALEVADYLLSVIDQQGRVIEAARRWQTARNAGRPYVEIRDAMEFALVALAAAERPK